MLWFTDSFFWDSGKCFGIFSRFQWFLNILDRTQRGSDINYQIMYNLGVDNLQARCGYWGVKLIEYWMKLWIFNELHGRNLDMNVD